MLAASGKVEEIARVETDTVFLDGAAGLQGDTAVLGLRGAAEIEN